MNFEDMATWRLKRAYFKWVKRQWNYTERRLLTMQRKAWDNKEAIKKELAHRGWHV